MFAPSDKRAHAALVAMRRLVAGRSDGHTVQGPDASGVPRHLVEYLDNMRDRRTDPRFRSMASLDLMYALQRGLPVRVEIRGPWKDMFVEAMQSSHELAAKVGLDPAYINGYLCSLNVAEALRLASTHAPTESAQRSAKRAKREHDAASRAEVAELCTHIKKARHALHELVATMLRPSFYHPTEPDLLIAGAEGNASRGTLVQVRPELRGLTLLYDDGGGPSGADATKEQYCHVDGHVHAGVSGILYAPGAKLMRPVTPSEGAAPFELPLRAHPAPDGVAGHEAFRHVVSRFGFSAAELEDRLERDSYTVPDDAVCLVLFSHLTAHVGGNDGGALREMLFFECVFDSDLELPDMSQRGIGQVLEEAAHLYLDPSTHKWPAALQTLLGSSFGQLPDDVGTLPDELRRALGQRRQWHGVVVAVLRQDVHMFQCAKHGRDPASYSEASYENNSAIEKVNVRRELAQDRAILGDGLTHDTLKVVAARLAKVLREEVPKLATEAILVALNRRDAARRAIAACRTGGGKRQRPG
jgi:hypothetical protein